MTGIIKALAQYDDSPTRLAAAIGCGVVRQQIEHWTTSKYGVPPEYCNAIKDLTGVPLWELRPLDWHLIWPDVANLKGAPDVPSEQVA